MTKNHIKRIRAPKTWNVERKKTKFIAKPNPGGQPLQSTLPLVVVLTENLKLFRIRKEVKFALNNGDVLVNGKARKDVRYPVGLFDVISIPKLEKAYRIIINPNNKLMPVACDKAHANHRVSKIIVKKNVQDKKIFIGTNDGRTILLDKAPYKTQDSLVLELPSQKIITHLPFEKGQTAFVFQGKHTGRIITIEEIDGDEVFFKEHEARHETKKHYIIIIGKELPELHLA
jgi:small subunit ribosomal protein S4e